MSVYEQEDGSFRIPPKHQSRVLNYIADAHKRLKQRQYAVGVSIYNELDSFVMTLKETNPKFKKNDLYYNAIIILLSKKYKDAWWPWHSPANKVVEYIHQPSGTVSMKADLGMDMMDWIDVFYPHTIGNPHDKRYQRKPRKPTAKDFYVPATGRGIKDGYKVKCGEAYWHVSRSTKPVECELLWHVPNNNHAVDDANGYPQAKILWRALAIVPDWPKNYGGGIHYSNEYDDPYSGGYYRQLYGNYQGATYGG